MPDGKYKRVFSIAANEQDIKRHDAILFQVDDLQSPGASASAYVTFYGGAAPMGGGGYPIQRGYTAGSTGDTVLLQIHPNLSGEYHTILPIQIKSAGGITGGSLYGLQ